MTLISSTSVLPANRSNIEFQTEDGLKLVGELCLPLETKPDATLVFFHPLPTAGGYMDSHLIRKAANRLPAMARLAVLRFNFRGVSSPRGQSEGQFGEGNDERYDLQAAVDFVSSRGLPRVWLVGWSFGTEVILRHALSKSGAFEGVVLLAPPLHRTSDEELRAWDGRSEPVVVIVPEHDDYLKPMEAAARFSAIGHAKVIPVEGAKHLFVGEKYSHQVLDLIVGTVLPGHPPLPTSWSEGAGGASAG